MNRVEILQEARRRGWNHIIPMEWHGKFELNYAHIPVGGPRMTVVTVGVGDTWEAALSDADKSFESQEGTR